MIENKGGSFRGVGNKGEECDEMEEERGDRVMEDEMEGILPRNER